VGRKVAHLTAYETTRLRGETVQLRTLGSSLREVGPSAQELGAPVRAVGTAFHTTRTTLPRRRRVRGKERGTPPERLVMNDRDGRTAREAKPSKGPDT
jgi:hypothetical protein